MKRNHQSVVVAVLVAVIFWFSDSIVHLVAYGEPEFELVPSDFNELWMRLLIIVLIVSMGILADRRAGSEKKDVYLAMLAANHHILKNFLQKLFLFRDEANKSKDFDKDILKLFDQMIDETVVQIDNLKNIQEPSRVTIEDRYRPG